MNVDYGRCFRGGPEIKTLIMGILKAYYAYILYLNGITNKSEKGLWELY